MDKDSDSDHTHKYTVHRDFTYFNIFPPTICDTGRVFSMPSGRSEVHMSCQKKAAECGFLQWFLCFPTFQVVFLACFCTADSHKKLKKTKNIRFFSLSSFFSLFFSGLPNQPTCDAESKLTNRCPKDNGTKESVGHCNGSGIDIIRARML